MISGHKDTDLIILSKMDDETLFSFCKIENRYVQKLCNDENFWRDRVKEKFGNVKKNENRNWKNLYLNIVHYRNKYGIFRCLYTLRNEIYSINSTSSSTEKKDILEAFTFQVLDCIYIKLKHTLQDILENNGFSETNIREFIQKYHDSLLEITAAVIRKPQTDLEAIERHPAILKAYLFNIISKNNLY